MSGFDIFVLVVVGVAAIGGFMRGLVYEVLSLSAWIITVIAIHFLHAPLYRLSIPFIRNDTSASLLSFVVILIISFAGTRWIAKQLGGVTRESLLGPIDRVLGFGFGAVKGAIVVVVAFSILVLGYDTVWGVAGRPSWITTARTYPAVNAGANEMVGMISDRRSELNPEAPGS